jgi:hypothetical protein
MERYNGPDAHVLEHAGEAVSRSHETFGYRDRFGREIGAEALITRHATRPPEQWSETSGEIGYLAPGVYFHARVQSTRDGARYGAAQSGETFATLAEAEAYRARRLAASRKAAARKAGA